MEAILLMAEAFGAFVAMRWVARGDGERGWPAWKPLRTPPPDAEPRPRKRR